MMTHEQSNFRRASVGLLQKGVHQILKTITTAKQAKFRACRVSRAVRMVKKSLRPETIQLGRCKEFFRPPSYGLKWKGFFRTERILDTFSVSHKRKKT